MREFLLLYWILIVIVFSAELYMLYMNTQLPHTRTQGAWMQFQDGGGAGTSFDPAVRML
jgi:hypothetical protein